MQVPVEIAKLAQEVVAALKARNLTIATAESCTGGMLAALLTDIEGCGHGFDRGFVTYSKEAKSELLGISHGLLDQNDAVSEAVARAMAEGALDRSRAQIAIAVTGFAGPAGPGQEEGLAHFALARRDRPTAHREEHFGALGRGVIRVKSLKIMLDMVEESLEQA